VKSTLHIRGHDRFQLSRVTVWRLFCWQPMRSHKRATSERNTLLLNHKPSLKGCAFFYDSDYFSPVMWVGSGGSEVSALNLLTKSATVIAM